MTYLISFLTATAVVVDGNSISVLFFCRLIGRVTVFLTSVSLIDLVDVCVEGVVVSVSAAVVGSLK